MSPARRGSSREGGSAPRSIFQYIDILRHRWISAAIAFGVVASLVVLHALFSTPTYGSYAMIQLDMAGSGSGDRLAEISLAGSGDNIDAELQVMASRSVARQAAITAGVGAVLGEENAYRPWESLLRSRGGAEAPTRIQAGLVDGSMPLKRGTFRLIFEESGDRFSLKQVGGETLGTHAFESGMSLEVIGESIRLDLVDGSPAGRTFVLRLRTLEAATAFVHRMAKAKQVGYWTGIVSLGAVTDDPYLAQRVAAALSQSYLQHKQERKSSEIKSRIQWLETEMAKDKVELTAALDEQGEYVSQHGAVLLGQKATAALEAKSMLFEQRLVQEQILMEQEAALVALHTTTRPEQVLAAIGASNADAQTQAVSDGLIQLEIQRGVLVRGGDKTEDPKVKRLDAQIKESRLMFARLVGDLRTEVEAQIERRIKALNNRLRQIDQEVERHEGVLNSLPAAERDLAELVRTVEAAKASYVFLERMKGESELALSSTLTQANEVDAAVLNTARQSPVLFRRALAALFLGLFAAIGMALVRHLRDRTVQTPKDLEEGLGLQLYAAIPTFSSVPRRQRRGLVSSLVVRDVPTSILTENYRTLRANIRFADAGVPIQTLAITSALPSEGKTVTTLNLAAAMARAGNSVVVVDADLRRPTVNIHLEGPRAPGTVEVLLGETPWREALQSSNVEGLSFIPAGRSLSDPSALLEAGHFEQMLEELRKEFEYVLFDVPPVLAVADAGAFFRSLDAVFLVARQGACPIDIIAGAQEQVERFGGNLLGAIFNGFDAKSASSRRYGYGGYYGYSGYYAEHASKASSEEAAGGSQQSAEEVETIKGA